MNLRNAVGCLSLLVCMSAFARDTRWHDGPDGSGYRFIEVDPESGDRVPGLPQKNRRVGFAEMPVQHTGVTCSNLLSPQSIIENNNFMNGSGVAAGDFDGDGYCDLYFCSITGTNALYRNLGDWRFENVTARTGVGLPGLHSTGAVFADIDGDGDLDLLVTTLGHGARCFINDGRGQFREATIEAGLESRSGSMSMAVADVDGDGDLDLYVANYGEIPIMRSGARAGVKRVKDEWVVTGPFARRLRYVNGRFEEQGEPDVLYLNDGAGRFRAVPWSSDDFVDEAGKPFPEPWDFGLTVQIRDMNGDGFPDIYVCNDYQTPDRFWINDGHGKFRAQTTLALRKESYSAMGVDFADADRDGFLDFLVVEMLSRDRTTRLRQINAAPSTASIPGQITNRPAVMQNMFYHNRGDGTYAEIANYCGLAATDWSWQPVFVDVDLDGYEDLLIVTGMPLNILDRDTIDGMRSLARQPVEQLRTNTLLFPALSTRNLAFRNLHSLQFEDEGERWGFDSHRISNGISLADLDNDGDLDVVINCLDDAPLLYRNEARSPRVAVRLRGQPPNTGGIGARIRVTSGLLPGQTQEIVCGGRYLSGDDAMRTFAAGSMTDLMTIEVQWRSGKRTVINEARSNRIYMIDEPVAAPTKPQRAEPVNGAAQASAG